MQELVKMRDAVRMRDAEKEALRLCPNSTVSLQYERQHVVYRFYDPPQRGTNITCVIWVAEMERHFQGPNWATALMELRNALKVNPPQPCPDEEQEALPA